MALAEIVARKRADVAARMAERPLESFRGACVPTERSLSASLTMYGTGFILECKQASPSAGTLRLDFDPTAIAAAYAPFASAVSVLTDGPFFGGSFEHLRDVRAVMPGPVLCKDFIVDPYQVYEARFHGADAVLLMLSVLDDQEYERCARAVAELGMEALTEVHDADEMARAARLGARVIGINNRNLKTLEVDLAVTPRLAPLHPKGALLVCESGVGSHADVVALRPHVDAFLVGSALMRSASLEAAVRELIFGRVKVCGLTVEGDAEAAAGAGAIWGGVILAPESRRCVTLTQARSVMTSNLRWAGVFVNEAPLRVAEVAAELSLDAVQLHGEEDDDYVRDLREKLRPDCEIWKAARLPAEASAGIPPLSAAADRVLLDTLADGARGGTGRTFDWSLTSQLDMGRCILSGGLSPANAAAADALGAWALDVNSGVEDAPGLKSAARLKAFFTALRGRSERQP